MLGRWLGSILISVCAVSANADALRESYARPLVIPFSDDAPYSPQIATLGKMLYFDPRLSGAQNQSCASCHNPSFGWEAPVATAVGAANQRLSRHSPTILNMAWVQPFFWDGRAETLEEQAAGPITAEVEMNASFDQVVARLSQVNDYRLWFEELFPGEGISQATIVQSIATFERTVVSGWAPFDQWVDGDESAISAAAQRGFELFNGAAGCSACHSGWNFTDNSFHDIGLDTQDIGRQGVTPEDETSRFAFKTPGLRNISLRAPYMHSGELWSLEDVIQHYASGGLPRPSLTPMMAPLDLDERDVEDLVAFLDTLTESDTDVSNPILPAN